MYWGSWTAVGKIMSRAGGGGGGGIVHLFFHRARISSIFYILLQVIPVKKKIDEQKKKKKRPNLLQFLHEFARICPNFAQNLPEFLHLQIDLGGTLSPCPPPPPVSYAYG